MPKGGADLSERERHMGAYCGVEMPNKEQHVKRDAITIDPVIYRASLLPAGRRRRARLRIWAVALHKLGRLDQEARCP